METEPLATNGSGTRIAEMLAEAEAVRGVDPQRALALCDQAIALAPAPADTRDVRAQRAQGLRLRGSLLLEFADYPAALDALARALDSEALGDQEQIARSFGLMGIVYGYQGLYVEALQGLLDANRVWNEHLPANSDPAWLSRNLNSIGYTYVIMEEPQRALPYLHKSLDIARQAGKLATLANGLDSLARAYLKMGDLDQALTHALESVRCARGAARVEYVAQYLLTVAAVHVLRGEYAQGIACIQEALAATQAHGFRHTEAEALRALGDVYKRQGRDAQGLESVRQALGIAHEIGDKRLVYQCQYDLAMLCKAMGDYAAALDAFEQFHDVKSAVFGEQADWRIRNLEVTHQVHEARKENEIFQRANMALQKEITERKAAQSLAEKLAITDSLTGLYNRRHFYDLASREIARARRYGLAVALAILDLDHFKLVNDTYGHPVGDLVLSITAGLVSASMRSVDTVCRYGGEEFAILMPESDPAQAVLAIERVRRTVTAQPIRTEQGQVLVTFSAGIAGRRSGDPEPCPDLETLIKQADRALYGAKHAGRNRTLAHGS